MDLIYLLSISNQKHIIDNKKKHIGMFSEEISNKYQQIIFKYLNLTILLLVMFVANHIKTTLIILSQKNIKKYSKK